MLRGLERMYGTRSAPTKERGLDVLVEAMLAQNTNMANATRGFKQLRRELPTWSKVLAAPVEAVQRNIAICGLARMRAARLQDLLKRVKAERGKLDIEFLRNMPVAEAYAWLTSFHGIGPKTAATTMLFGFDAPVLPVDNGVLRVVRRLRLVAPKARDALVERALSPLVRVGDHYATHVLLFTHAKQRCRPKNPRCDDCALLKVCPFGQRRVKHRPGEDAKQTISVLRSRPKVLSRFVSDGLPKDGELRDRRK